MSDYQTKERMDRKERAIPLPSLMGKTVLDVGCDYGHWCWLAAEQGASVLGIDRHRNGIDLTWRNTEEAKRRHLNCNFVQLNVGKQWHDFGKFDVVFLFSAYHHIFENCHDHLAVWYWLWKHTGKELLWENPTGNDDAVVRINVTQPYLRDDILKAAHTYFDVEHVGPALHEKTRQVWRCRPRKLPEFHWRGKLTSGGGGASKAFAYSDNRRVKEIAAILGYEPYHGTLNAKLDHPFGWYRDYFRAQILETPDRADLSVEWKPRWVRFYPVKIDGVEAHAIRFEGESYPDSYIEFISSEYLRSKIGDVLNVRS